MKKIEQMTVQEKIGQLICVGFLGETMSDQLKYLIDTYKVGNVILFTRNIKNPEQLFNLNKEIHEYCLEKTGIMPFISIDQEGGMVTRIMEGATFPPGNMTLATQDPQTTFTIGQMMGQELRALGINMNLAPSLDVNNNPNNPVIGVRSYSDDPEVVSLYGKSFINGLQSQGVVATAKHFPGHGDTESDSHKSLPVIPHNKERLSKVELKPFIDCLNDTKAIMSAHVFFTAYESESLPATLSKKVITDLLRNELGYKGLIVSDCMEMKAIADHFTTIHGCKLGLLAGLDQVMVSQTFKTQEEVCLNLFHAYRENQLTIEMIDEKVERILNAKADSYNLMKEHFYNKKYSDVKDIVENENSKRLVSEIVDKSLTLVKGKNINPNLKTLVIATEPFATTIAEDELSPRSIRSAIKEAKLEMDVYPIKVNLDEEEINKVVEISKNYEQVFVATFNANLYQKQAMLINKLNFDNLFVLSTRSPYDIYRFWNVKNYLCLYEYTPNSVKTIVKYLQGRLRPSATSPVSLNPSINLGASVYVGLNEYTLDENLKYLKTLKEFNINYCFISAHMKEMHENYLDELKVILEYCQELKIKVSLDVGKPNYNNIKDLDFYAIRLDYGFTPLEISEIYFSKKHVVELNASTTSKNTLDTLVSLGVDLEKVRISHNFYPKPYTGLDSSVVIEKNRLFHSYGMKVMIYIPSHNQKRPPIKEGLVTVEEHRKLNYYAILSSIKYLEADEVFIADAFASLNELEILSSFNFDLCLIPIIINEKTDQVTRNILTKVHRNRTDSSSYFIRSSIRVNEDIMPFNTVNRELFDLTIDNALFKRYQGEVSIIKKAIPLDPRVNVIGKCLINEDVLKAIETKPFKFVIIGETC